MPEPVKSLKHYEILSLLGKGGMGEVYLAQDTNLHRKVAIKFLPTKFHKDKVARERFLREARSAAALDHPFICKIYEAGEVDGTAYIAMEYVEGETIKKKIENEPLDLAEALRLTLEVAEALEVAHSKGFIHRDLKPANLMCTPQGHIKVMDFGLAKQFSPGTEDAGVTMSLMETLANASLTGSGMIVGTLAYMSPEQARGDPVDARSDIFSLGVILDEMVTGKHPFDRNTPIETLTAVLRDDPPSVHVRPRTINPAVSRILYRALAKNPEKRYQTVSEFGEDIKKLQRTIVQKHGHVFRSKWAMAAAVGLGSIVIAALGLIFLRPKTVAPPGTGPEPISVLISDFENRTGDPIFDGVLEKTFDISLAGTSFLSVFSRQEAIKLASQLDGSTSEILNDRLALLVSRRAGISVVIGGSIEKTDKGYAIEVWALDTVKNDKIYDESTSIGAQREILRAADRFSDGLRSKLGGVSAESVQALTKETFTTTSLEAMQAFARGQELDDLGRSEEALKEYLRAIDHDPNFGRAYASMAVIYLNEGRLEEADDAFQEAMKRIDQMTDREKYRTRGIYYLMVRDWKKAVDEYSALLKEYPGDYVVHAMLAIAYFFARDMPKAVEEGRLDVKYNPQGVHAHNNLSWYTLATGDLETAEEESRAALKIQPEFTRAYVTLALTQIAKGQPELAAETYRELESLKIYGASLAATGLADLFCYEGRVTEATKILQDGIAFDLDNGQSYDAAAKGIMLAQAYLLQENKALAVEAAAGAVTASPENEIQFSAALVYIEAGREGLARALHTELNKNVQPEPRAYAKLVGGELSRARGDIGNAIKLFQEAKSEIDTWLGHVFLGLAYLQAEDYTAASSEFEICFKRSGEAASIFLNDLPSFRYLPPLHYYLGRSQEGFNKETAAASYGKFLKLKEKSDGSDPMVADARRRLDALR